MRNVQLFCIAGCSRWSYRPLVRIQKRVQVEKLPASSLATLFDPQKPLTTQLQCISWLSCQPGSAVTNILTVFLHLPATFIHYFQSLIENLDVYQINVQCLHVCSVLGKTPTNCTIQCTCSSPSLSVLAFSNLIVCSPAPALYSVKYSDKRKDNIPLYCNILHWKMTRPTEMPRFCGRD